MNLRQARCLDLVASEGSFRAAAIELGITQPAVSRHITQLERELGVRLVERVHRGATLTAAGRQVLPRVRAFLAAEAATRAEAAAVRAEAGGLVRVAAVNFSLVDVLAEPIARFVAEHPEHRLEVREVGADEVVARVAEAGDDLGVTGTVDPLPAVGALRVQVIGTTEVVLALPEGHRLAGAARIGPDELAGEPLVAFNAGWAVRDSLDRYLRGQVARIVCEVGTAQAALVLVAAGVGPALVPAKARLGAPAGVAFRDLAPAPLAPTRLLIEPDRPTRPPAVEAFAALVASAG